MEAMHVPVWLHLQSEEIRPELSLPTSMRWVPDVNSSPEENFLSLKWN